MHHHHHHYLASPTSPFSQTNSAPYFGYSELAAASSDGVTIRDVLNSVAVSLAQNFSHGPLRSPGPSESSQKVGPSVLWIKHQTSEDEVEKPSAKMGPAVGGETQVTRNIGLIKGRTGSQLSNTSGVRSIEYPNKLPWSEDYDSEHISQGQVTGRRKQTSKASKKLESSQALRRAKKHKDDRRLSYESHSNETSASDESPSPRMKATWTTAHRALQTLADPWKPKCIHGAEMDEEELAGKTSTLYRYVSETAERPLSTRGKSCNSFTPEQRTVSGSGPYQNGTTHRIVSAGGSDNVSGFVCTDEKHKRPHYPPAKAARKNISSRASRREERRTPKGPLEAEARDDGRKTHPSVREMEPAVEESLVDTRVDVNPVVSQFFGSQLEHYQEGNKSRTLDLDGGNRTNSTRVKGVREWRDVEKVKISKAEMQSCLPCFRSEASTKDSGSLHENEPVEDIISGNDRSGTEKLKSEYMQDPVWTALHASSSSDVKTGKSTTQNRFREAVEAAWKTNLGTKSEPESEDLSNETVKDMTEHPQDSRKGKNSTKTVAHFDQDDKSPMHDDTAKMAEEGMRDLLDERALFRAKFKEEMEQGVTDRLRLQELLQLEKFKLEATERELMEVKRSFQEALLAGAKANQKHACESLLENQPLSTLETTGVVEEAHDDIPMKLKSEAEARMAAEARASYLEKSAKAAEDKIQHLMEEKNRFYSKFKEHLGKKCMNKTDKNQEKVNHAMPKSLEKSSNAQSSVPDELSDGSAELSGENSRSNLCTVDGKGATQTGNEQASNVRRIQEFEEEPKDKDRRKFSSTVKLEESRQELVNGTDDRRSKASLEHQREADHDREKQMLASQSVYRKARKGKKRSLSPASSSSSGHKWEPNLPFSLKIERCTFEDGKTTTTFNISPAPHPSGDSPNSKGGCKLEIKETGFTESATCSEISSDFVVKAGDEELVGREVKSYTYKIPDKLEQHAGAEEPEETASEVTRSETDENFVDRSYEHSESERSEKQSDVSPAESRETSICSEDPDGYKGSISPSCRTHTYAGAEETPGLEVDDDDCDKGSHGEQVERGESSPFIRNLEELDNRVMLLPSKWKREAKAELRRIIQEQEVTWKIAEDAVDELGRRLELLERYKMELQDNLSRRRGNRERERVWNPIENGSESSVGGFSSLYHSPIFEERLAPTENVLTGDTSRQGQANRVVQEKHQTSDPEIQKLKADIEELKNHIVHRSSRANSPVKEGFTYNSFSSPPSTPPLPPPPATPATPPTPPTVPDYQQEAFQQLSSQGRVIIQKGSGIIRQENGIVGLLEATCVQAENVKTVISQDTRTGRNGYSRKEVDRHRQYHENARSGNGSLESRIWVPVPDDEINGRSSNEVHNNGYPKQIMGLMGMIPFEPRGSDCEDDCTMLRQLKPEEGEVEVFKEAMQKISAIFWDREGNLKGLGGAVNMTKERQSQYNQMRNFYVDLLREMSEQLGELCVSLQTDASENNYNNGETVVRQIPGDSEVENLRAALGAAERKIIEEVKINCQLKEKLSAGDKHLSRIMEEHAQELIRKENTVSFAQQLNNRLANEMSATESSLAELRARYKSLVANLEGQLTEAREEVSGLQSTLADLKSEMQRNQNLVVDLERAGQEKQLQIQELTERTDVLERENEENQNSIMQLEKAGEERESQLNGLTNRMRDLQNQKDEITEQKSELLQTIQELRREADGHQKHIKELVNINEELIDFAQAKEDQVNALAKEVTSLQQVSKGKSDEANKLAVEAAISLRELMEARRNGESYRTHCETLKLKLEQTEQELIAREDALERLTRHLETTIEGQDLISQEKEQVVLSLSNAQYKERRMEDQIKQSKVIIDDMEDKLAILERELGKANIELAEMRARGKETLAIEQEAEEMRNRVHQLEEEIMEKEGQISILKSSYPREFESTF
ncbi:hypothetical protein R1sor_004376 [Riccia sorocarpa]|uniref:Uncharacterized protein n=1 Tax=Riccia sorocarpa TaxID=122646 RepID=A0ABD3HKU9_9MARC